MRKLIDRSLKRICCAWLVVAVALAATAALAQTKPVAGAAAAQTKPVAGAAAAQTKPAAAAAPVAQSEPPVAPEATLNAMLTALQTNSMPDFVANGEPNFQMGMTPPMFANVAAQFGPRLARGYTATFLGTLNQQGYTVYLWKLVLKDGRDDLLVTMAVRGDKVAGFFMR